MVIFMDRKLKFLIATVILVSTATTLKSFKKFNPAAGSIYREEMTLKNLSKR